MNQMTSRERVLTALSHKEPDRVPLDISGIAASLVNAPPYGYQGLCDYLGITDYQEPEIIWLCNTVWNVDQRILQRFHGDFRHTISGGPPVEFLPDDMIRQDYGVLLKKQGPYFYSIPHFQEPLRNAETIADVEAYPRWPDPTNPVYWESTAEEPKRLRETTDHFIVASPPAALCHVYAWLRGFDTWLKDMKRNPKLYHHIMGKLADIGSAIAGRYIQEVSPHIDGIFWGDDIGMQTNPFISPHDYRTFVKPYFQKWSDAVKSAAPHAKLMYHTCGNVYDLIPDFIDVGVDVLNPIQPKATKMEPWRLKKDYGNDICFYGGIDIQEKLPLATPDELREYVKETIDILAPGGGWILAPAHNIEPEVPPQNIVTLYDTAFEYGRYPIGG